MHEQIVINNEAGKRYEMVVNGQTAYLEYLPAGPNIVLSHTEVPVGLEGQGIRGQLVKQVLDTIRANGQQIIVTCPFVLNYLKKHREYLDLVFGYKPKS